MPESLAVPLRLAPRLDPKPWGGRRLERFGLPLPLGELVGEAVATAGEAIVAEGPLAGRMLGDLAAAEPTAVLGVRGLTATGGRTLFPLLVKLIDAEQDLSIQVHPDDAAAASLDSLGKTEAYHVLAAAPGATIALGLRSDVPLTEFEAACRSGRRTTSLVRWLPAVPGTTILIPAGTVHAVGAGCLVYEVQQPSDITYRLDDWGRVDAAGRARPLHVDEGLAALDRNSRPEPIAPLRLATGAGRRQLLAACRFFGLERLALAAGEELTVRADGSPQVITCLRGGAELATGHGCALVASSETSVITAAGDAASLRATAPAVLLRAWVPDLRMDVVAPARAAGHSDQAIAALAGPLPDVREALG